MKNDKKKTKPQLIDQLAEAQQEIAELERTRIERDSAQTALEASETRWHTLVDNAPNIIVTMDRNGTFLYVNRAIPGLDVEQVLGTTIWDYLDGDDMIVARDAFEHVFNTGEPVVYTNKSPRPDGRTYWWQVHLGPIVRDAQVVEVIGIVTDITEHQEAKEALKASEMRWRTVVENAPDIIATVDSDGTLLSVNRAMPGVVMEQVVGMKLKDIMHPDDRDKATAVLKKVFQTGEAGGYEGRYLHPDGHLTWWETHIGPVKRDDQVVEAILITTEVTERVHAEGALRQSEARWRTLVENAPSLIFTIDSEGIINYITHSITGRAQEQVIGTKVWDYIQPEYQQSAKEAIQSVFRTAEPAIYRNQGTGIHGPDSWWEVHVGPIKQGDDIVEAVLIATDITEREQAEEAIRESEELFRSIYADSPIAIMRFDADGKLIDVNKACLTMWDISKVEDSQWSSIFAPDQFSSDKAKERIQKGEVVRGEIELDNNKAAEMGYYGGIRADTVHLYILASPLGVSEGGTHKGYIIQIQDITAIRQSERALRGFSRRLVDVQEAERRHLARELHDQIGQTLTGLRLLLEMATMESSEKTRAQLQEGQAAIKDLMTKVGNLSLDLRPSMLDDLGLMPSLLWHFEHYTSQTGIRVIFEHDKGQERRFPSEVETAAYRIVQEALTNVARHAGVQAARVRLVIESDTLTVEIQDQGSGFDPKVALTGGSSGLLGMRERANSLGGQLIISSEHGRGTDLVAELPLELNGDSKLRQDEI